MMGCPLCSLCGFLFRFSFFAHALLNDEGQSLLQFKASIYSDPSLALSNWSPNDQTPCAWTGVSCSTNNQTSQLYVISLNLPRAQLHGSLAPALGALPHLRHLNLHHNQLQGAIPPQLFHASQLQSLFLFSNNLSGLLPPQIGRLSALQNLDLSANALSGTIPTTISNCTRLTSFHLSHNSFTGPIPEEIGTTLRSLKRLDVSFNLLNDSIPSSLGQLKALLTMNVSHNQLSGSIPQSLGSLRLDSIMDLSNNNLSGPIPRSGALANQTKDAFLNNGGLCGAPLRVSCASPTSPARDLGLIRRNRGSKGLSKAGIACIAVGDAAGVGLVCAVFLYCYWRRYRTRGVTAGSMKASSSTSRSPEGAAAAASAMWLCNKSNEGEEDALEKGELVALDSDVMFSLDELLRASAYVLGKSGVGIVYKVIVSEELTLAVRRLGDGGADKLKEFHAEVETIGAVRHPNIVRLRAYYWAPDEKLLVYDYIPNGSLASALHGQPLASSEPLLWPTRLQIAKGTARALAHLHDYGSRRHAHGDVKPSNILLDLDMQAHVADFGLTRLLDMVGSGVPAQSASKLGSSAFAAAPDSLDTYYRAPETANPKSRISQKWDVYSFGVVLLELLTGPANLPPPPSPGLDLATWTASALDGSKPLSHIVDPMLLDEAPLRADDMLALLRIALACVASSPDQRPSMSHVADALGNL